jgi:hypothetical protein
MRNKISALLSNVSVGVDDPQPFSIVFDPGIRTPDGAGGDFTAQVIFGGADVSHDDHISVVVYIYVMIVLIVGKLLTTAGAPIRYVLGSGDRASIAVDEDDVVSVNAVEEISKSRTALQKQWNLVFLELHNFFLSFFGDSARSLLCMYRTNRRNR